MGDETNSGSVTGPHFRRTRMKTARERFGIGTRAMRYERAGETSDGKD